MEKDIIQLSIEVMNNPLSTVQECQEVIAGLLAELNEYKSFLAAVEFELNRVVEETK